jgi:hypothetical protein
MQTAYDQYLKAEECYDNAQKYGGGQHEGQNESVPPEVVYKDNTYVVQKYIS